MRLFNAISNLIFGRGSSLSEQLEKIGYFDLINDKQKLNFVKEKIDFEYQNNENEYIGSGWFIIPNDWYISAVYNLKKYNTNYATSDFRAFEVSGEDLFRGGFNMYMEFAKVVFEKNGFKLDWKDEIYDENSWEKIRHRITINNNEYIIYSGPITRETKGEIIYQYVTSFKHILNDVIQRQNRNYKVIILTEPEHVNFILLENTMLAKFKDIVKKTKSKIEE